MKKTKLLTPILTTIGLTSAITPMMFMTSCGDNNEENHATAEYSTPVVGTDFVIKFKLDTNYSLDMDKSNIEFADSNGIVTLNKCIIDSENKTITVPSNYVTSTTVKVTLKSIKNQTLSSEELKQAINTVFADYDNKNLTLEGQMLGILKSKDGKYIEDVGTPLIRIKAVNHNVDCIEGEGSETNQVQIQKANDFGYWLVLCDTYNASPLATYGLSMFVPPFGMSDLKYEDLYSLLKYDSSLNSYQYSFKQTISSETASGCYDNTIKIWFDSNKQIKNIITYTNLIENDQWKGTEITTLNVTNKGNTSFDVVPSSKITYNSFVSADKFNYSGNSLIAKNTIANKFISPVLSTLEVFDSTKTTYVYFNKVSYKSLVGVETTLYNGSKLLTPKKTKDASGDYYFYRNTDNDSIWLEINSNVLTKTEDLKFVWSSVFGAAGVGEGASIEITQVAH